MLIWSGIGKGKEAEMESLGTFGPMLSKAATWNPHQQSAGLRFAGAQPGFSLSVWQRLAFPDLGTYS